MFDGIKDGIYNALTAVQEKYDSLTDSVAKLNQDMLEIRDTFVSIKNVVVSIFSFIGQETAVLLFCTALFLFIFNLIPFLFFDKKARYYIGICFGSYLSITFGYTVWSLIKYILIMLSPLLLEYLLFLFFKTAGKTLWFLIKKGSKKIWKAALFVGSELMKKVKKKKENEK